MCLNEFNLLPILIKGSLLILCSDTITDFLLDLDDLDLKTTLFESYRKQLGISFQQFNSDKEDAMKQFLCDLFGSLIADNKVGDFKPTLYTEIAVLFIFMRNALDSDCIPDLRLDTCMDLIYNFLYKKALLS